jgi:hypothetical protein
MAFVAIWKDRSPIDYIVKVFHFGSPNFRYQVDTLFTLCAPAFCENVFLISDHGPNCCVWRCIFGTRIIASPYRRQKMRNAFVIAGIFALATAVGPTATWAQAGGSAGMQASGAASAAQSAETNFNANNDGQRSLARADKVAGTHGLKGRNVARTHGANKTGFCPPGQAKKPGMGSRFQC